MTTRNKARAELLAALVRNTSRPCAVCGKPRQKLGSLCEDHDRTNQRTGSPIGRIHRATGPHWRPYMKAAERFLDNNAAHPAILAAQAWAQGALDRAIYSAGKRPWEAMARLLVAAKEAGCTGRDVLVRVLAAFAWRRDDRYAIASERMFAFNLVALLTRMATGQRAPRGTGSKRRVRLGVAAREYIAGHFIAALGPMAMRAADAIAPALSGVTVVTPPPTPRPVAHFHLHIPLNKHPI
nr:hypothetical protein [Nitrosomonas nitrosa]